MRILSKSLFLILVFILGCNAHGSIAVNDSKNESNKRMQEEDRCEKKVNNSNLGFNDKIVTREFNNESDALQYLSDIRQMQVMNILKGTGKYEEILEGKYNNLKNDKEYNIDIKKHLTTNINFRYENYSKYIVRGKQVTCFFTNPEKENSILYKVVEPFKIEEEAFDIALVSDVNNYFLELFFKKMEDTENNISIEDSFNNLIDYLVKNEESSIDLDTKMKNIFKKIDKFVESKNDLELLNNLIKSFDSTIEKSSLNDKQKDSFKKSFDTNAKEAFKNLDKKTKNLEYSTEKELLNK
ncbi:hypothetical protein JXR93_08640 [bacterium]|nr:hypothetical protein [bacterium]